jgi:prepilin-type processing-associated H-X9-DG protein
MKTLTATLISLLLVVIAVSTPAQAELASVLLQEGLYAEEIEGDLDAAIKIYEKIIAQAEQTEQAAAMAMYRIGMCRLKKGDKAQAATQFQQLIEKFPAQTAILAKARSQLANIQPAATGPFGPVIERVICSEDSGREFFFDLDAAKAFSPPEGLTRDSPHQEVRAWSRKNGIDCINDRGRLELADMIAARVEDKLWDSAGPAEIESALKEAPEKMSISAQANTTYAFKTREGGSGILQILEKKDNNLRIRYKMFSNAIDANLYMQLPPEVIQFVGNKYGSICAEARAKNLYSNSHVYYVTPDFILFKGGMGYYHNISDRALFNKIRLCGTSEPKQTHYDIAGREMNTEIVPDKVLPDFYHIYWTPHQPVPAGEMFYYGWCIDKAKQLPPASPQDQALGSAQYKLTMQNQFGNPVIETFFLVVPTGTEIVRKSEDYTAKDTIGGFDVYSFSKEVAEDANHQVDVVLAGPGPAETKANLYEWLPNEVLVHIGGKYGSISAEGVAKSLYSNSHIYFVTSDWVLLKAGMGYYRNGSGHPQTARIHLSGTSYPNQTLYDIAGRQMNIEIVQDDVRSGFYHIYWTPSEALPPGQMFYYGWCIDDSKQLRPAPGTGHYALEMQNKFGQKVVETFFLVVPEGSRLISKTEDFTAKDTVAGFDIYYWSKEVPTNTNNKIDILLAASADGTLFGPVQTATIYDIDHRKTKGKHCTIDLDTGLTGKLPVEQFEASSMDMERYLADEGVDAVGEFAQNEASLIALGMVVEVMPAQAWETLTPGELISSLSGRKTASTETKAMQWNEQGDQSVFAFLTREGAMGLLQILSADEKAQSFELRYKKLKNVSVLSGATQERMLRRHESAKRLRQIGISLHMYASDHAEALPDTLDKLKPYIEDRELLEWIRLNVEYVGRGVKLSDVAKPQTSVLAYDTTLMAQGVGTNVLFFDAHVEFITVSELKRRGIAAIDAALPSQAAVERDAATPRRDATPPVEQPDRF